jgi:hypothetical protein
MNYKHCNNIVKNYCFAFFNKKYLVNIYINNIMSSKVTVEPASLQVEYQAVGGKKKVSKKDDNKKQQQKQQQQDDKKKQQKQKQQQEQQQQQDGKKKQQKQQEQQDDKKKQSSKKGGAIVDDVKNLAVPFAILLAKEGLSKMFKEDPKKSSKSLSAASAAKPSSTRRRTTMSGGSCNLGCTAQTGGQAAKQLFELQNEIDRFLQKY